MTTQNDDGCMSLITGSAAHAYWGKARGLAGGPPCHLLPYHSLDVAAVGQRYLLRQPRLLRWMATRLGVDDTAAVRDWSVFCLALHDLGKFSISFQGQRADLVACLQGAAPAHLGLPGVRHDSLGWHAWREFVQHVAEAEAWFGADSEVFGGIDCWLRAVTGHHGQPPLEEATAMRQHFRVCDELALLAFVRGARSLLLTPAAAHVPQALDVGAFELVSREISWWVAGIAVLADWIGSNADVFHYRAVEMPLRDYWPQALRLADRALAQSGVLPVQQQRLLPFGQLFPHIGTPSPLQDWAITVELIDGPQLHLLEDVTGAGKTEAAVMLTHRLLAGGQAEGFFIGLPTMATANAMYGRIAEVYDRLFMGDASLVLAHAKKTLVEKFAASVIEPGEDEADDAHQSDESATRRCQRWLADHNKRALLAPAGVGTVDQALLAALRSKHQSLRLLGLVGKVLVVDEVHACDDYMQRTLESLLRFHACAGGSAVLLSATLTTRMKAALLAAFAQGCGQRVQLPSADKLYPLTTSWAAAVPTRVEETPVATRPEVRRRVAVRYEHDVNAVVDDIVAALAAGHCVAWVRNTIGDALNAYDVLCKLLPTERITLFHARFALGDRLDTEQKVLARFGPDSTPDRRAGQLLIATQVAEQSLDVDFDLVVSDLAPIDRLIQRAGRLRRHVRDASGRRLTTLGATDQRGEPCLWLLGPAWTEAPAADWFGRAFPKVAKVYPHHGQLWRTAKVLQRGHFAMPDDARQLIEDVFADDDDLPEPLLRNANTAVGQGYANRAQADMNSIKPGIGYARVGMTEWAADTVAPSRLGEESVEVLVGRWQGNRLEPWRAHANPRHAWAYSTLRMPSRQIAGSAEETHAERRQQKEQVLQQLPGAGKWVTLLGFDEIGGAWRADAVRLDRHGGAQRSVWRYDRTLGLVQETVSRGATPPSTAGEL